MLLAFSSRRDERTESGCAVALAHRDSLRELEMLVEVGRSFGLPLEVGLFGTLGRGYFD